MVSGMRVSLPTGPHLRPPTALPRPAHRPAPPGPAPPRLIGAGFPRACGAGRGLGAQLQKSLPGRARGSEGS